MMLVNSGGVTDVVMASVVNPTIKGDGLIELTYYMRRAGKFYFRNSRGKLIVETAGFGGEYDNLNAMKYGDKVIVK